MVSFVALLRAVNVGGTGKLPMDDLKALCEAVGFEAVRTYIASGNVVFKSKLTENQVKAALEASLQTYAGRQVGVAIRTGAEMIEVLAGNPFVGAPVNRVMAVFLDEPASPATLDGVTGRADDEEVIVARREIYIRYGQGMGASKLRVPAARLGTARNMNTVAKLTEAVRKLG